MIFSVLLKVEPGQLWVRSSTSYYVIEVMDTGTVLLRGPNGKEHEWPLDSFLGYFAKEDYSHILSYERKPIVPSTSTCNHDWKFLAHSKYGNYFKCAKCNEETEG